MSEKKSRRKFIQAAGLGAAVLATGACRKPMTAVSAKPAIKNPGKIPFELGMASYSLRKLNLAESIRITKQLDLHYICLKSFHMPLDAGKADITERAAMIKKAGLELYGGGVIYMNDRSQVNHAFEYAKTAGMEVIVGVPKPELLDMVNDKVKEYDIKVAIHNHGPTDDVYPVPAAAYEKIKDLDPRIGLCNDIGHTKRAGVAPGESIRKFGDRLLDLHMKDVSAANAEGYTVEIGRGVIDIPDVIRALMEINYKGIVSFEYEKDPDHPTAGLAESVGYVRGVIAAITS